MKLKSNKIKVLIAIVLAFVLTMAVSETVFLAGTPRINQSFLTKLMNLPKDTLNNSRDFLTLLFNPQARNLHDKVIQLNAESIYNMTKIGQGVYAKEDKNDNFVYVKITNDAQWDEKIVNYNGKQFKILIPKNSY